MPPENENNTPPQLRAAGVKSFEMVCDEQGEAIEFRAETSDGGFNLRRAASGKLFWSACPTGGKIVGMHDLAVDALADPQISLPEFLQSLPLMDLPDDPGAE